MGIAGSKLAFGMQHLQCNVSVNGGSIVAWEVMSISMPCCNLSNSIMSWC